jgi:hypothetical protein
MPHGDVAEGKKEKEEINPFHEEVVHHSELSTCSLVTNPSRIKI